MKQAKEILQHIAEVAEDDFFGVIRSNLVNFLSYEDAKEFLKEGVTKKQWTKLQKSLTKEVIIKSIEDYMPFAWEKANDCRGLSANRSIDHMRAYLWLLDDGNLEKMEEIEYEHYGKEQLIFICEQYNLDWKQWDNRERTNG